MWAVSCRCLVFLVAAFPRPVCGGLFLAKLSEHELKRVLIAEIEAGIGGNLHDVTKSRLDEIENALRPTFEALPKDEHGRLDHDGLRYLLNRFFHKQHGWMINGLQDVRGASSSRRNRGMRHHIPEVLQDLFEKRVKTKGSTMRDAVLLAAVTEHLIRDELRGRLEAVYEATGFDVSDDVDDFQFPKMLELYTINFLRGDDASAWSAEAIATMEARFHLSYPGWPRLKALIRQVRMNVIARNGRFSLDDAAGVLEVVADRFTTFYQSQCTDLKNKLLHVEEASDTDAIRGSGRVRLVDFYRAGTSFAPEFAESVDVLRSIGALDEVDPANTRVIIPNYVSSFSNCIARTTFYSTCCQDGCAIILDSLERALGKGVASRDEVIRFFSDGQAKPLTSGLLKRLDEVARHHGGRIPLHGRLFAQWMHFVHPRECKYPHTSDSTLSMEGMDDFLRKSRPLTTHQMLNLTMHLEDVYRKGDMNTNKSPEDDNARDSVTAWNGDASSRMWTMEEELIVENSFDKFNDHVGNRSVSSRYGWVCICFAILLIAIGHLPSQWQVNPRVKQRRLDCSWAKIV